MPTRVEVFTSAERPIAEIPEQGDATGAPVEFHIYALDGIARTESRLSADLPADPKRASSEATRRIHALREEDKAAIQQAALGLAKMVQYGLDRFPAIVLDGEAVVLGVTDLGAALEHYRRWRRASAQ